MVDRKTDVQLSDDAAALVQEVREKIGDGWIQNKSLEILHREEVDDTTIVEAMQREGGDIFIQSTSEEHEGELIYCSEQEIFLKHYGHGVTMTANHNQDFDTQIRQNI